MKNKIAVGVLLILLYGCDGDTTDPIITMDTPDKYGIILNACGPTDAGIVRVYFTDEAISCSENTSNIAHVSGFLEYPNTETLAIGMMLEDHGNGFDNTGTATSCDIGFANCASIGRLTIEIFGEENDQLQGTYSIDSQAGIINGSFSVKRCNNMRPLCG